MWVTEKQYSGVFYGVLHKMEIFSKTLKVYVAFLCTLDIIALNMKLWYGQQNPMLIHDSASRRLIIKKAKVFWKYVKHFLILPGVRNYRILIGLCKWVFMNCPIFHFSMKIIKRSFLGFFAFCTFYKNK